MAFDLTDIFKKLRQQAPEVATDIEQICKLKMYAHLRYASTRKPKTVLINVCKTRPQLQCEC